MSSRTPRVFDPVFEVLVQAAATDDLRVMRRHTFTARAHREQLAFIAVKYQSIHVLRWLRVRHITDPLVHADLLTLALRYPNHMVQRHLANARQSIEVQR